MTARAGDCWSGCMGSHSSRPWFGRSFGACPAFAEDDGMSDEPKRLDGKRWGLGRTVLVAFTVLAVYVLSAGPVAYLDSHGFIPERTIPFVRRFYLPVAP